MASEETQSFPQPTGAPSFEKVNLYLKYRKQVSVENEPFIEKIDLLAMNVVGEIHYYETVFSPAMSVMMTIVNPNIRTKIFEEYDIRGGEKVEFEIRDYLHKDSAEGPLFYTGTIAQVDHYTSNNFAEVFRLRITTDWKFPAGSGVQGIVEGTADQIAKQILKSAYETNRRYLLIGNEDIEAGKYMYADQSSEPMKFNIGLEKKDNVFVMLMRLASKAAYKSDSAGFFFYRNRYGYFFRSIDKMIEDGKKTPSRPSTGYGQQDVNYPVGEVFEYEYNGYNPGAVFDVEGSFFTAVSFQVQTGDTLERSQYNIDADNTTPSVSVDFLKYTDITTKPIEFSVAKDTQALNDNRFSLIGGYEELTDFQAFNVRQSLLGLTPLERDPLTKQVTFYQNNEHRSKALSVYRYSSVLDVSCTMVVPLNLKLVAGTIVKVNINKLKPLQECSNEEEIVPTEYSGLYIIAAVCHAMDRKKGYSSLHLVRDHGKLER